MLVEIKPIFHRGTEVPFKVRQDLPPIVGTLHLHEERVARIGRTVRIARIKDPSDAALQSKIAPLYDAVVEYSVLNKMRIRGVEEEEGALYGQCWDVVVTGIGIIK